MTMVEETEQEERNPFIPRVIRGGKGPPEGPEGINWLSEFPKGTTFVCRAKQSKDVDLNLYHVIYQHPLRRVTLLGWRLPDGKILEVHVDPMRFSNQFEHTTILGTNPVEEENDDDERDRTNRLGDVVLHEAVPGIDQLPQAAGAEEPNLPD